MSAFRDSSYIDEEGHGFVNIAIVINLILNDPLFYFNHHYHNGANKFNTILNQFFLSARPRRLYYAIFLGHVRRTFFIGAIKC